VVQKFCPQDVCHWGSAHGQPGMTGICFLDTINSKKTDGVDTEIIKRTVLHIHYSSSQKYNYRKTMKQN
jgi:hypothetical protein